MPPPKLAARRSVGAANGVGDLRPPLNYLAAYFHVDLIHFLLLGFGNRLRLRHQ
jgi:hypothetical protein